MKEPVVAIEYSTWVDGRVKLEVIVVSAQEADSMINELDALGVVQRVSSPFVWL